MSTGEMRILIQRLIVLIRNKPIKYINFYFIFYKKIKIDVEFDENFKI
jgi:hypothetical protein